MHDPNIYNLEREIEMARILHSFVESNIHLFSPSVLKAAQKLLEEIEKLEAEIKRSEELCLI